MHTHNATKTKNKKYHSLKNIHKHVWHRNSLTKSTAFGNLKIINRFCKKRVIVIFILYFDGQWEWLVC